MEKRKITLGPYITSAYGWTLTWWKLSPAEQKTNYVDKPGGDGSWDLSTAQSDGVPKYKNRVLTVNLESSVGGRLDRKKVISNMVNLLDGYRIRIKLPDDEDHYLMGTVHIETEYNDEAHAAVTVTADCDPWLYAKTEKTTTLTAASTEKTTMLQNSGRRAVVPTIEVAGAGAVVLLTCGAASLSLAAGTHQWPDLLLMPKSGTELAYKGNGTITITYREAVLE